MSETGDRLPPMTRRRFLQGSAAALGGLTLAEMLLRPDASVNAAARPGASDADWPMLARDAARSGATPVTLKPPFERKWYRLFPEEGLMSGIQPIISSGRVYAGTLAGTMLAMDAESGEDAWIYRAGGPVLHTSATDGERVYFGAGDGRIYAVRAADGKLAYSVPTDAAVWNAPLVHRGIVYVGGRDGRLYALDAASGKRRWSARVGGPLLSSPAIDEKRNTVYVAAEDMRVYALDLANGRQRWRSEPVPGASFRGYHPVVAPDGSVMTTVTPVLALDQIIPILLDMVKEVFGDFASWRHTKDENDRLREANFKQMQDPQTYRRQMGYLRRRLTDEPAYQTFFVLDPASGRQKYVTPIVYSESMNGTGAPPLVTPDGRVIVKYQALLRSRYEHYSPFLNVGWLDTATGDITPIMDQDRTYGWYDSLLLVHDEQCQLVLAGDTLINTHQCDVNGLDLPTRKGYPNTFALNIHEPRPGEAVWIWQKLLRGEPVPPGEEWLARGTAVYGGGSVIDMPVSVAGDSFYYVPTHELNAGAAIIAYRAKPGARLPEPPAVDLSLKPEEARQLEAKPWDWDTLETERLKSVLAALPAPVSGTRRAPLTETAAKKAEAIADTELDRIIWEEPRRQPDMAPPKLRQALAEAVREALEREWRPLVFPSGKHPIEAYRFFTEPTETLYTLARAYPHLDEPNRRRARDWVAAHSAAGQPLDGPVGHARFDAAAGTSRAAYALPPERLMKVEYDIARCDTARLYPVWLWASASGDWSVIERHGARLEDLAGAPANDPGEDCRNGYVAGLIAACRIARRIKDREAENRLLPATRAAMRERLAYEFTHPRGGVISLVPVSRSIFARWRHLTPEVGRLLATHAGDIQRELVRVYVDYHRPAWWLAWNVELMMRNESPFALPSMSAEIFAARAMVLGEKAPALARWVDLPWCRADMFYIQKLACCLDAAGTTTWS